jgi:type IV pilus assembly protein PilQ
MVLKTQAVQWSKRGAVVLFGMALLWGCATPSAEEQKQDAFFDEWKQKAEEARGHSPSARKRVLSLSEEGTTLIQPSDDEAVRAERPLPNDPISLKMHNAEVAVVLRALARAVGQNIIINETVRGTIKINVSKAPWDQVFRSILRNHGLTYEWEGDIIRIVTLEDKKKNLEQLEAEQQIKSKMKEIEMVAPLVTRIVGVDYANAEDLQANLTGFLTRRGGNGAGEKAEPIGAVMVDKHTNSLIIQAMQGDIEKILRLIEALDKPTPQVLIEAHIVETTKDTARDLGVQWGGLFYGTAGNTNLYGTPGANAGRIDPVTGSVQPGTLGQSLNQPLDPTTGMASNFPADISSEGLFLGFVAEKVGKRLLSVQLSALEDEGKLNILSSPSITTLDNQEAIIESGQEVPYQTVEDDDVEIKWKKAVLSLKVTPHVIDDQTLKLEIITNKDELDFENSVLGNPTVITKSAQTNVILFDGQTTVIGGLSKETAGDNEAGIPWLKDIPILGYLFKSIGKSNQMEDVLIFITPHILEKAQAEEKPQPSGAAEGSSG